MPESFHDRQWRSKAETSEPDPATRTEIQLAALTARLAQVPLPLSFVKPAAGWDASFDLDPLVMTNPDIAANGWTISLTHTPYTALTRAGDVRWQDHLWGAAPSGQTPGVTPNYPPAVGTYYSTLFGGRLLLQLPGDQDVSIWRATSNPPSIYSVGIGGGTYWNTLRHLFLANGAPGAAGVVCGWVAENSQGQTSVGAAMGGAWASAGMHAMHLALEAYASQVGHAVGRYVRAGVRPLFANGTPQHTSGALVDTQHGNGIYANTSRVGLRLMSGPAANSYLSALSGPIELFYIRRQPHRGSSYF
jgi:hypothetical protein